MMPETHTIRLASCIRLPSLGVDRMEKFCVRAELESLYALPSAVDVLVSISHVTLYTKPPWIPLSELVERGTIQQLPDDFFPQWGPI